MVQHSDDNCRYDVEQQETTGLCYVLAISLVLEGVKNMCYENGLAAGVMTLVPGLADC